jgi:hypothetical protein
MQVEGIPKLTKQEINDIKFVCGKNWYDFEEDFLYSIIKEQYGYEDKDDLIRDKYDSLPHERRTTAVSQAAIMNYVWNLKNVPENIQTDEFLLFALGKDGSTLHLVDRERQTNEMYMTALESSIWALKYFPKEMITAEIAMKAVEKDGWALKYVPDEIKTPEMCRKALNDKNCEFLGGNLIGHIPFSDVCLEYMKNINLKKENPYVVFSEIRPELITSEIAQLAIRLESESVRLVPERILTPEMCLEAVKKKWFNIQFVPEQHRTPEVCLQAVISCPDAKMFVPERFAESNNIYRFYGKLKDELFGAGQLSFEQVQKLFTGETILVSGMYFANIKLKDFNLEYDRKTNRITMKALDEIPKNKKQETMVKKPVKRKGIKI